MSSISGAEMARLVLGYLQSQKMDQIGLNFAKESPYLLEEYQFLKRGIKMKTINRPSKSLHQILKEFIGIEESVTELFDDILNQHEVTNVPYELLQLKTLKDKVKYICRNFKAPQKNVPCQSQSQNQSQNQSTSSTAVSRKRPNISNVSQNSSDSDLVDPSSPLHSMSEQNSSNYSRPSKRRRLIDDPDLIIEENTNSQKQCHTPIQVILQNNDPTSSKYLQMSTSKLFSGNYLSESVMKDVNVPENIAEQINKFGINEVSEKAGEIAGNLVQDLFDSLFINYADDQMGATQHSSSAESSEIVPAEENRELNTPIPNESSSSKSRYDLRSGRKSGSGASVESKRTNAKPQILSNELILPKSASSQRPSDPIVLSDSDTEAVTTTSQQYQNQQQVFDQLPQSQQQQTGGLFIINGQLVHVQSHPGQYLSLPQYQATTSTVECPVDTIITSATTSNASDDTPITIGGLQLLSTVMPNQYTTISDDERNRVIVIDNNDVDMEGNLTEQTIQIDQQTNSADALKTAAMESQNSSEEHIKTNQIDTEKTEQVAAQLTQISTQKVVTPKQFIRSNIPGSSRSLSTPRNKNPHVRVLDFNCTPRRLAEINENKNESISNTSRFFNETPHNRSIALSLPSSAPPKVDSTVQSRRTAIEQEIESVPADVFVPIDENTRISGDGETPKVRKSNRRSCVRSISSHKENHPDEERAKRVATTKKKICPDDGDSNASEISNKKPNAEVPISAEDAMAQWRKARDASKNHDLFEQQLREQNSKKQASEHSTVRKKRPSRSKKKPAATVAAAAPRKKPTNKKADESTKSGNVSLNSTIDNDLLNSTQLNLEAQLLEDNLRSAKKATPAKQMLHKSAKKKTPNRMPQIKLMPSPRNKALKRLRSSKNLGTTNEKDKGSTNANSISPDELNAAKVLAESNGIANLQVVSTSNNHVSAEPSEKSTSLQNSKDIEAGEILIGLQQEIERRKTQNLEIQHESISMSQHPAEAATEPMKSVNNEAMAIDKSTAVSLNTINQPNLSMSALLETPFKDCGMAFPRTPNLSNILSQLDTPMARLPCPSLMNDSIFKNPQWPTPKFAITPGAMFSSLTPLKDALSPRSEDVVYGAANRPTDYSSSSSYYKPDESDGIDRQIQAGIQSAHKNSDVYSADDLNDSSKIDDTTQNTSRSSSSSSSSSSDSSSDSDSDSNSSSSSDSEAEESFAPDQNAQEHQQPQEQQQQLAVDALIDDGNTQEIKSHLSTTPHIAQNILLSEPEPIAPILEEEDKQTKLLDEKLRRMQESLRETEMKNFEKQKPKQIKKYHRAINEAKRDRLRGVQAVSSPSKRKSTQPKKVISIHSQQIYSEVDVAGSQRKQVIERKVQSIVVAERLKAEAAGDNAIVGASAPKKSVEIEESVEAIQKYIDNVDVSEEPASKKNVIDPAVQDLIDTLPEKHKKFEANRQKSKTEVIDALPLPRATRSRARNQRTAIAPAKNLIISQPAATKPTESKLQRRSKENKPSANASSTNTSQNEKPVAKRAEPPTAELVEKKSEFIFETPAKQRESREKIRDLFGDCTDIETPIKSPPKPIRQTSGGVGAANKSSELSSYEAKSSTPEESSNGNRCPKFEADSSNLNADCDETDESDDDEEQFEMVLSIDESDKKRFFCIRENALAISKAVVKPVVLAKKKVVLPGNIRLTLEPSDVMELYTQDVNSVAEMKKNKERTRSTKEPKIAAIAEPTQSESDSNYGKPLHTSTPSPTKSVTPKFNIKHKSTTMLSPKSAKKQNDFNSIKIDDILHRLHPATE